MFSLRRVSTLILGSAILLLSFSVRTIAKSSTDTSDKMRDRLEQLFIWRVSDRLQLTPEQEKKFNQQYKDLTDQRKDLTDKSTQLLDQLALKKSDVKASTTLLKDYKKLIDEISRLQTKEMDSMEKIFGSGKLVEYVLLKRELTQKFKDALAGPAPQKNSSGALKEPTVIQE